MQLDNCTYIYYRVKHLFFVRSTSVNVFVSKVILSMQGNVNNHNTEK